MIASAATLTAGEFIFTVRNDLSSLGFLLVEGKRIGSPAFFLQQEQEPSEEDSCVSMTVDVEPVTIITSTNHVVHLETTPSVLTPPVTATSASSLHMLPSSQAAVYSTTTSSIAPRPQHLRTLNTNINPVLMTSSSCSSSTRDIQVALTSQQHVVTSQLTLPPVSPLRNSSLQLTAPSPLTSPTRLPPSLQFPVTAIDTCQMGTFDIY